MIDRLYQTLAALGYTHPLHPMLTHIPMGMVIGMVIFSFCGSITRKETLMQTASHCSVLALIAVVPVMSAGLLDWQHLLGGSWNPYIIAKMILASLLTVLLVVAVVARRRGASRGRMLLIYLLCFGLAGGLGYCGGQLVYG